METDDAVAAVLVARFTELQERHRALGRLVAGHQDEMAVTWLQMADCRAAARLFGVTLPEAVPDAAVSKTVGDVAVAAGMAAYPNPVRASAIRELLSRNGRDVHEKSVGVALNRLKHAGRFRCVGRDWYFVPEIAA